MGGVPCIAPGCSCQQAQPVSGTEQSGSPPGSVLPSAHCHSLGGLWPRLAPKAAPGKRGMVPGGGLRAAGLAPVCCRGDPLLFPGLLAARTPEWTLSMEPRREGSVVLGHWGTHNLRDQLNKGQGQWGALVRGRSGGLGPPCPGWVCSPNKGSEGFVDSRHLGVGCERVGCWQRRRAAGTTGAVAGAPVPSTPVSTTREGWALLEHSWSTGCAWRLGHKG